MVFAQSLDSIIKIKPNLMQYEYLLKEKGRLTPVVKDAFVRAYGVKTACDASGLFSKWKMVAYIAGPLTGMTEEIKQRYKDLSDSLAEVGVFGYAPHVFGTDPKKHPNVSAQEVRDVDYLWAVVMPHVHFNYLDPMAHGNAIEEGWAEASNVLTIYLSLKGQALSRLVKGMDNIFGTITYEDHQVALAQAQKFGKEISEYSKTNNVSEFFNKSEKEKANSLLLLDCNTGRVGKIRYHDWIESGTYFVDFGTEWKEYPDRNPHFRQFISPSSDANYILLNAFEK
jgi:hypothetical protein